MTGKNNCFSVWSFSGLILLCFGVFWLGSIVKRCEVIYPRPAKVSVSVSPAAAATAAPEIKQYRLSPHFKQHHAVLLWVLVVLEIVIAFVYAVAGYSLLRRFVFAVPLALAVLAADALFKSAVLVYMQFAAIPLAKLIGSGNILTAYFLADKGFYKQFSAFTSGLMIYLPGVVLEVIYLVTLAGLVWILRGLKLK